MTDLSKLKESVNVEFKEATTKIPDNFYETYSSFSNTDGGTICSISNDVKQNP